MIEASNHALYDELTNLAQDLSNAIQRPILITIGCELNSVHPWEGTSPVQVHEICLLCLLQLEH